MNRKLLVILFLFFSCIVAPQKIDKKVYYNYSDDVQFRILQVKKQKILDVGSSDYVGLLIAEKGKRFVSILFQFKNNSSKEQLIDFEKIFLKDNQNNGYFIDSVVVSMSFSVNIMQFKLKPNAKRTIIVGFNPTFDKNEIIDKLLIGEKLVTLKYR